MSAGNGIVGAGPAMPLTFILEQGKRVSESTLWQLGQKYFDSQGQAAWETNTVPSSITNNPFIANVYANIVLTYLHDCMRGRATGAACALDPQQPIYIVELAVGSGRFSQRFLRRFLELKNASSLKALDVRFVMTDFTENNVRSFEERPGLKPFLQQGILDFATFNMDDSDCFTLRRSGHVLAPGTVANPLIVLGNYALDSSRHDLFRVVDGKLLEGQLTTRSRKARSVAEVDACALKELILEISYQPASDEYYGNPELDRILAHYRANQTQLTFEFPIGSLRCIDRLLAIANGRLLLLSSDIGYSQTGDCEQLSKLRGLLFYGGPVAYVNYHALGQYFVNRGGQAFLPAQRGLSLQTAALVLGGTADDFADTGLTFQQLVNDFGPSNLYCFLQTITTQDITPTQLLDALRLSQFDPRIFLDFNRELAAQVHFAGPNLRAELLHALAAVEQNFDPLDGDLPFELARVYLTLRKTSEALRLNMLSLQLFGQEPATWFNIGLCHYQAGDLQAAQAAFEQALTHKPDFDRAQVWRARAFAGTTILHDTFLQSSHKVP